MLGKVLISLILSLSVSWLGWTPSVSAGEPMQYVQSLLEKVTAVLNNHAISSKEEKKQKSDTIKKLIAEYFDIKAMARNSLGDTWNNISNEEKRKFSVIFSDLFQDSYTGLVLNFLKKEELEFLGESMTEEGPTVQTRIRRADDEISVTYFLKKESKRLAILDVDIDGVRIVQNYKEAFGKEIKRNSFASLMQKMETRRKALITENS
jgi:phospholipid transport system substrate-binding protein